MHSVEVPQRESWAILTFSLPSIFVTQDHARSLEMGLQYKAAMFLLLTLSRKARNNCKKEKGARLGDVKPLILASTSLGLQNSPS